MLKTSDVYSMQQQAIWSIEAGQHPQQQTAMPSGVTNYDNPRTAELERRIERLEETVKELKRFINKLRGDGR